MLIYAGLMALTKDYKMLPFRARSSVNPSDKKKYAAQLAKVIALVALAPAISAIIGIWSVIAAAVVLVVAFVLFIWLGARLMRKVQ